MSKRYYNKLSDLDITLSVPINENDFELASEVDCTKCGVGFMSHSVNKDNVVCQRCKRPWAQSKKQRTGQYDFTSIFSKKRK